MFCLPLPNLVCLIKIPCFSYNLYTRLYAFLIELADAAFHSSWEPQGSGSTKRICRYQCGLRISSIPLPHVPVSDRLRFVGDDLAQYSVRKAYNHTHEPNPRQEMGLASFVLTADPVWCWKVFRGCIPTKDFLYTRGMALNIRCMRCNAEEEH